MTETNGNGKTVKEMVSDLSGRVEAYAAAQNAAIASLQTQVNAVSTTQAVHEAGDGHAGLKGGLKRVEDKLDNIALAMAEKRGEERANARAWKIIAAVASIPGVSALLAVLLGFDPTGQH